MEYNKRNLLVETMENALPGFEESSVAEQRLEPSEPSGAFPTASSLAYLTCGGLILEGIPLKRPTMVRSLPTAVLDKRRLSDDPAFATSRRRSPRLPDPRLSSETNPVLSRGRFLRARVDHSW